MPEFPGLLLALSGPSGVGKSTLVRTLINTHDNFYFSVSATTRLPRPGEKDTVHYHFLTRPAFSAELNNNAFLEHAEYGDHLYGTPKTPVFNRLRGGDCVLMDIDVQGAIQVKAQLPEAILIFVSPPDFSELERRLRGRASEQETVIARRLSIAEEELAAVAHFDYFIINDKLENALTDINAIIRAENCRSSRHSQR